METGHCVIYMLCLATLVHYSYCTTMNCSSVLANGVVTNKTKCICYDEVGCFSNASPFDNANFILPKSPNDVGTMFLLYTRESNEGENINYANIESLRKSRFQKDRPIKFIIHGFANDNKTQWIYDMTDELLKRDNVTVIKVIWGPGAAFPNYLQAVANTRVVAEQTRILITNMVKLGAKCENIHLIGHSLGAHASGQIGELLKADNCFLGRISGLDPAEPNYVNRSTTIRLDKGDAIYVDVIHTNGAPFSKGGAGLFDPCGHVDFYVNGGLTQPDCPNQITGVLSHLFDILKGHSEAAVDAASCSHSRAHDVFIESVNSQDCQFTSYPCKRFDLFQSGQCLSCGVSGCGTMGYDSNFYFAEGMMFLDTRGSPPFCGHHYGIQVHISNTTTQTRGKIMIQLNGTWDVSEWLNITRSDDTLKPGQRLDLVAVPKQFVGRINSINVKYSKKPTAGNDTLDLRLIKIECGESGLRYSACLDASLRSDHVTTFGIEQSENCPTKVT